MTTTVVTPIGACTLTEVFDANGYLQSSCIDCPEQPEVIAQPERVTTDRRLGWNAGARSAAAIAGDCYTQFSVPMGVVGVACGLSAPGAVTRDPRSLAHGFFISQKAGAQRWWIVEGGATITVPVARAASDVFRIERRASDGVVRYLHNGRQKHVSTQRARGELVVVACLYAAGDGVL